MIKIKSPVTWIGNKTSILHILYALFPIGCDRYVEPFGGSGAVLLGKPVPDKFEVFNDYNHNLVNVSVFIELKARSMEKLKELQSDIAMELTRSKISVDRLTLRQKEGFLSVIPTGYNQFGAQYERVLPASSVANMYPFNFSGKTDPHGSYIGRDKYGTNILVDFDRRAEDKTTSNILILGNSGQGKSYLLKLILTNIRESGKRIICLDPESEYEDLCDALGGCYIRRL